MRIDIQTAIGWTARAQQLIPTEGRAVLAPNARPAERAARLEALAAACGGLAAEPNHAPIFSVMARLPGFQPGWLMDDQKSRTPVLSRALGLASGAVFAPRSKLSAIAHVAAKTGDETAKRRIAPLRPDEVRQAVRWVHGWLKEEGRTYPDLRQGAPPDLLRPVQRGTERALYQDTALQQVLLALEIRGDVVSSLADSISTGEGPYRYQLRSRLASNRLATPEEGYIALADWYIHAFAPAAPRDLAAWSGLRDSVARRSLGGVRDTLAVVEVPELGEDLLAPAGFKDLPPLDRPFAVALPWLDRWFHAYRDTTRFFVHDQLLTLSTKDLVLISFGPGVKPEQFFAARIRLVGSARAPRFQVETWRPLADFENEAVSEALSRLTAVFGAPADPE